MNHLSISKNWYLVNTLSIMSFIESDVLKSDILLDEWLLSVALTPHLTSSSLSHTSSSLSHTHTEPPRASPHKLSVSGLPLESLLYFLTCYIN